MNDPAQVAEYALLGFSGIQLAIPQREVVSIDLVTDIDTGSAVDRRVGSLVKTSRQWPVYALSDSFEVLQYIPQQRRFCVSFGSGGDDNSFALVCDLVEAVSLDTADSVQPLPASIVTPVMPMQHCFRHDNGLVLVSDQLRMQDYFLALEQDNG
ncbi:MAG: hypothetical protein ABF297_00010 [Thiogranum sp.]